MGAQKLRFVSKLISLSLGSSLGGGFVYATSAAEVAYSVFHGGCSESSQSAVSQGPLCSASKSSSGMFALLQKDFGEISENAYLASLADERRQALSCAQNQIADLLSHPQDLNLFAADISEKLIALLKEKKKMETLQPALGSENPFGNPKSSPGSAANEYRKTRARAEALLSYLPFTQTSSMQKMIAHITSQSDFVMNGKVAPEIEKYIQDMIIKTLPLAQKEIGTSLGALKKAVDSNGIDLDTLTKESLAQDTELVENFLQRNSKIGTELKPIACRVDAKFGKGAQYRDRTLFAVSILGSAVGAGVPALATRAGIASELANAGVVGRSAGILRFSSWVVDTSMMVRQVQKACFGDLSSVSGKFQNQSQRCDQSVLTTLSNDSCTLTTVLGALGAPGSVKNFRQSLEAVKSTGAKTKYIQTPAGSLREDKNHFDRFHQLLQSGQKEEAQKLEQQVQDVLSHGDMKVVRDIGGTSKGGGKFVKFSDGTLGVWKPSKMKSYPFKGVEVSSSELAAYKLDRYLGLNQVPTVVERKLDGESGTVQLLVGGLKKKPLKDDPEELLLFDYLIANRDRHDENYLLTKSGQIVAIDHGLALKKSTPPGGFKEIVDEILDEGERRPNVKLSQFIRKEKAKNPDTAIPKEVLDDVLRRETAEAHTKAIQEISAIVGPRDSYLKLKNASASDLRSLLGENLNPEQMDQLLIRRKEIVEAVESARSRWGDKVFRAGPASPVGEIHNDLAD